MVLNVALLLSAGLLVWRHVHGPMGFSDPAASLFWIDKWSLSPVRLLNLGALLCLLVSMRSELVQRLPTRLFAALGMGPAYVAIVTLYILATLLTLCVVAPKKPHPVADIADDVLRAEVAALDPARPVVVVTNDQAVLHDVKAAGANTVSSDAFLAVART